MSYRKIVVNGTTYKYTVGRTHVKVSGVGTAPKEDIGCNTRIEYDFNDEAVEVKIAPQGIAIKPYDLARWIRGMVS